MARTATCETLWSDYRPCHFARSQSSFRIVGNGWQAWIARPPAGCTSLSRVKRDFYRHVGFKQGAWRDVGWWQRQLQLPSEPNAPSSLRLTQADGLASDDFA